MTRSGSSILGRRSILLAGLCAVLICGAIGVWWWNDPTPEQLLQRGLTVAPRDAVAGETLLRRALSKAGGRYPDAEISLARLLTRQGDWTAASTLFGALDKSGCRADLLLTFARDALAAGHRAEAIDALEFVAQRGGSAGVEALQILVSNYQDSGLQDQLVNALARLTEVEPDNPQRWAQRIDALKGMLRESDCLAAIREAQQHDLPVEFRAELQHRLVQQLLIEGDTVEVRKALDAMRKSEGESIRVRAHDVVLLRLEGRLEEALKLIETLALQVSDKAFIHFNRGVLNYDLGHYPEAVADFQRVVEARPFDAQAQFKLSEAYRNSGQDKLARQHRQLAAGIAEKRKRINALLKQRQDEPRNPQLYQELARLHDELGERESARKWALWLTEHPLPPDK